jgi:hypothetical protein
MLMRVRVRAGAFLELKNPFIWITSKARDDCYLTKSLQMDLEGIVCKRKDLP